MTRTFKGHFDGKVFVPDEPVDLPVGKKLAVSVAELADDSAAANSATDFPLKRLAELAKGFPTDPNSPGDRAAQHDHYLYGAPKRP